VLESTRVFCINSGTLLVVADLKILGFKFVSPRLMPIFNALNVIFSSTDLVELGTFITSSVALGFAGKPV